MNVMMVLASVGLMCGPVAAAEIASTNVLDHGAKGDGKTDDTAAFQKALDSAKEKGGIVLVPAGTYVVAGSLNVPQGVTLRGVWDAPHHADIGKGSAPLTRTRSPRTSGRSWLTGCRGTWWGS